MYVRISFKQRGRKEVHLKLEEWDLAIASNKTMVKHPAEEQTEWTGHTFNIHDVFNSEPDSEYSEMMERKYIIPMLDLTTNKVVMVPVGTDEPGRYQSFNNRQDFNDSNNYDR